MPDDKLEKTKERILNIGNLPTLPKVATEVMSMAADPEVSIKEIASVISKDPSLSAKILKVANSAFYGLTQRIASIQLALVVLGLNKIKNLVVGVSVFKTFPIKPGIPAFDREKFWEHSAGCGQIAKILAGLLGCGMEGEEFVAGLLHDIGKIILDQFFHDEFVRVTVLTSQENIPMIEAEEEVLGTTHAEIGSWLAEEWKLPLILVEAITHHHEPEKAVLNPILTSLVRLSDLFCKAKGIGFSGDTQGISFSDRIAWKTLKEAKPELRDLDVERFVFDLDAEIEKAREFIRISSDTYQGKEEV
jgi:putative nucleotidyltransferase with HDIG domain